MKTSLESELTKELDRATTCPFYKCVVFVHPNDELDVIEFTKHCYKIEVRTLSPLKPQHMIQHDYSGCQLTTVLVDLDCFGIYEDGEYLPVNGELYKGEGTQNFIMYMMSRLRSESEHYKRMVII